MNALTRKFQKSVLTLGAVAALMTASIPAHGAFAATPTTVDTSKATAIVQRVEQAGSKEEMVKAYLALTPEEQKIFIEASTVTEIRETTETSGVRPADSSKDVGGASPDATTSCGYASKTRSGHGVFGNRLFSYTERVDFCWNGSSITSASRSRSITTDTLFWQFKGHINSTVTGGAGHWSYRAYTQGEFALCAVYVACVQFTYPWVDITAYGNGTYSWSTGGS